MRHCTLTHSCNQSAWCVPQKSISGAVGATLGNAPYFFCQANRQDQRTATHCLRHRTLTHSCNQSAWCVPQKLIAGAVGATLGNAPYKIIGEGTAQQCLRHRTIDLAVPLNALAGGRVQ
ncbi:hypothetical protein [Microcystis aeruginosa]|uniref:hypothetical protein n=1 Tax=Microcystis aeruginosa TaxID=1126 RepID=UPI00082412DC|nr:hypothetical protein [Microcystis aeruginosa]